MLRFLRFIFSEKDALRRTYSLTKKVLYFFEQVLKNRAFTSLYLLQKSRFKFNQFAWFSRDYFVHRCTGLVS